MRLAEAVICLYPLVALRTWLEIFCAEGDCPSVCLPKSHSPYPESWNECLPSLFRYPNCSYAGRVILLGDETIYEICTQDIPDLNSSLRLYRVDSMVPASKTSLFYVSNMTVTLTLDSAPQDCVYSHYIHKDFSDIGPDTCVRDAQSSDLAISDAFVLEAGQTTVNFDLALSATYPYYSQSDQEELNNAVTSDLATLAYKFIYVEPGSCPALETITHSYTTYNFDIEALIVTTKAPAEVMFSGNRPLYLSSCVGTILATLTWRS
eukprot:Blabericola_migrator_1__3257@NODE_195_length_11539_cov_221_635547_g168_i0_p3_GENE_NODE_195_length_11539_cov_221_635547_g168_i0NODE_195_length_11539_cov_221_635547_g168_i0_p3_ORF_typecomplete_len264_score31_81_NODE_195_length_11539_cov_221_635547_g168_i071137904